MRSRQPQFNAEDRIMNIRQAVKAWGWLAACACVMAQAQTLRVPDGTQLRVRFTADLLSSQATVGARVDMEVSLPLVSQGVTVIPAGSVAWGAVQEVKKGKVLNFDIEGVRLPNQQIVKLRVSPRKTTNAGKDEIKVDTQVGGDLGVEKGSEYIAYLDQDLDAEGAPAPPAQPAPVAAPKPEPEPPAPVASPAPAAVAAPPAPTQPETPPAPAPAVAAPATAAPAAPEAAAQAPPVAHTPSPGQPLEYITLECFSDPLGADILIDDEFHGSTPSILKIQPGNHRIEYRMMGYKPHSQPLNLRSGDSLTTVRVTMEKQP